MTTELDIHPASPNELVAAHTNVFDIWNQGRGLEDHIRHRLTSPSATRARWFVGCVDGRVVTSLGCYPLQFRLAGEVVPGIAIGSVYTLSEFRGRGFAPRLLAWVEDESARQLAVLSVLYSDIEPRYYARLGYVLCPSLEGWCDVRTAARPVDAAEPLTPLSVTDDLPAVMQLYADYHGAMPLSIVRDREYWDAMLKKRPDDEFFGLWQSSGKLTGFVRIGHKGHDWRIQDFALVDQSHQAAERLYTALLALAVKRGVDRVGGWMPDSPVARKFFVLGSRRSEITMVKPLTQEVSLAADHIAGTSRFCEIDHV